MSRAGSEISRRPDRIRREGDFPQSVSYDAIVVLGSKIRQSRFRLNHPELYSREDTYVTNDYRHSDVFGILGAGIRLVAAEDFVIRGATSVVVFTGGISQKTIDEVGRDVPRESVVYRNRFERILNRKRELARRRGLSPIPDVSAEVEAEAVNTAANVRTVMAMMGERQWQRVGIITNDYHRRRVSLLLKKELEEEPGRLLQVDVIGAEAYLQARFPGKYDRTIKHYNSSVQGLTRRNHERKGRGDLRRNQYHTGEYQLVK